MRKGWEIKKFSEVYDVRDGTHDSPEYVNKGYALITSKNLKEDRINYDKVNYISEEDYININKRSKVDKGDVLFAMIGTIGNPVVVLENPNFAIKNVALFKVPKNQNSNYLKFYLDSPIVISKMTKDAKGATQKFVGLGYLRNFEIPLPPLSEQQEIVSILDYAFESIERAKSNTEQNLKNAKDLFDSYLQNIFEKKGKNWEEKTLGEACKVERGSSPRPIDKFFTEDIEGVNWIKIGDTKHVDKYIYSTRQKITKDGALQSRFVDIDDFILSNSMSFGKPYIMKTQGYIHDGWFVLRLPKNIDTEFFWYLLASPYTMNQFVSLASGAIVKNISGDLVKKTILPIPPLNDQKKLVKKLDDLSKETKRLENMYLQKLNDLEELKKSILQKAFNGELKTSKISA